jgi:1,2-diacylglycerol 3-alpha-glucosyltransferase
MAAGVPVAAVEATGVSELIRDGMNGRLISREDPYEFGRALEWVLRLSKKRRAEVKAEARITVLPYSHEPCAERALAAYRMLIGKGCKHRDLKDNPWEETRRILKAEWEVLTNLAHAAGVAAGIT